MARLSKGTSGRQTQSSRAGLSFSVARIARKLRQLPQSTKRVSKPAGVYLTAVVEYLMAEIIELAGNAARDNRHARISPRHVMLAVKCDNELDALLKKVIIPGSGVIPSLHAAILPRGAPAAAAAVAARPARVAGVARAAPPAVAALPATLSGSFLTKPQLEKKKSGSFKKASKNVTVLSERTLPSGQKLTVVQADITDVVVDAIVHPTNNSFYLGGEVGAAISRAGGAKVRNEVQELHNKNGNLASCGAAISGAGDKMLCNNIIHVHSPHWDNSKQAERIDDLTRTVQNVFAIAESSHLQTIALPSISSGGNGYPKQVAAQTILRAINSYFKTLHAGAAKSAAAAAAGASSIKQVYFVLYDPESVGVYTSELGKLEI